MNASKPIWKLFGKWVWIPMIRYYLSYNRKVKIGEIILLIPVGVFHPTLFLSTKLLLEYIQSQSVKNAKVLELGAGSGLLSVTLAKRGALATASDISQTACYAVKENGFNNNVSIDVICSDLFDDLGKQVFDLIIINPPYYPKDPQTEADRAWYCGAKYEYFHKLFIQLANYIEKNGKAIMVLSEDCNIGFISGLAARHGYVWKEITKKKYIHEWNYLFSISL